MKPVRNLLVGSFLLFNTSRCNLSGPANAPQGEFRHSVSSFQCGPADGPATAVLLARDPIDGLAPANPYVRVVIQRPASELGGTSWTIGGGGVGQGASAFYSPAADEYEEASSGTVRIDRVVAQERVEGRVELRFPSRTVTEVFSAPWIEMFILCG
ncbi:MAG TPA: hypothetical protein VFO67_21100 [Gemmatimonadales bacterium]|nr:hypothetical protein [Gemmatimonadales bacterium]